MNGPHFARGLYLGIRPESICAACLTLANDPLAIDVDDLAAGLGRGVAAPGLNGASHANGDNVGAGQGIRAVAGDEIVAFSIRVPCLTSYCHIAEGGDGAAASDDSVISSGDCIARDTGGGHKLIFEGPTTVAQHTITSRLQVIYRIANHTFADYKLKHSTGRAGEGARLKDSVGPCRSFSHESC